MEKDVRKKFGFAVICLLILCLVYYAGTRSSHQSQQSIGESQEVESPILEAKSNPAQVVDSGDEPKVFWFTSSPQVTFAK